ncbi:MAG: hypothetical protein A2Y12_01245 [Planctomycetes bacterium GWF2_42_9]|nr:MAG: hypothetical protein A2Y12_01245 [Planctomycetes bacterium GWF2_42_9]HAL44816.1 hypothetical protein [Phycisphaerales bacterium]
MKKFCNIVLSGVFVVSTIMLAALFGCSTVQNRLTPAELSKPLTNYAYPDGNIPPRKGWFYNSKSDLIDAMFNADIEHIKKQADLEYQITKDKSVYSEVTQQAEFAKKQADADQQSFFGQNGLLAMGLGLLSGSSLFGIAVNWYKNRTMYSEDEVKVIKNEVAANTTTANYTEPELQLAIEKAKNDAINWAKSLMYSEEEVKEFKNQITLLLNDKEKLIAQVEALVAKLGLNTKADVSAATITPAPNKTLNS